jgi:hypothetical protein
VGVIIMEESGAAIAKGAVTPSQQKNDPEENTESLGVETGQYLTGRPLAIVIISLCLGTFLVALDINIIGVAVPEISSVFNSLEDVAWYGSAYLLTVTAFQPIVGSVYKFFDVRATYLMVILIFEGKRRSMILPGGSRTGASAFDVY